MPSSVNTFGRAELSIAGASRVAGLGACGLARRAGLVLTCAVMGQWWLAGCQAARQDMSGAGGRLYPPRPQVPRVVALGTLRGGPPPSQTEVDLSLFLFGAPPPSPLVIANPTGLAADGRSLLICDNALSTVFRWDAAADQVGEEHYDPPLEHPFAVDVSPDGTRLICDRGGVRRFAANGRLLQAYALEAEELKPGGVLAVGDTVWVSNGALHRIEVFEAAGGRHLRSIGQRGAGGGQFALPRGMARTPDGHVCIVDLLNCRVQVLDAEGKWVRDIGGPGDSVGSFGRPKDVAVGPDGTVFVTDAFSQRVHAFGTDGQPLLAFGEPGSGPGELTLPSGVAVSTAAPRTGHAPPADATPAFYVMVGEQLDQPGVRVYAWLKAPAGEAGAALPIAEATKWKPRFPGSAAVNPHWNAERCGSCHKAEAGRLLPIALQESDALCLSCHDGVKAPADPHPIGREAHTDVASTPEGWPTVEGRIGCLTCHDIQRHCAVGARRPAVNYVLLRGYDPQRPLEYCGTCHHTDVGARFSPHRQRDATGRVREDACLFCHAQRPEVPEDGRRRFEPKLRTESSALCLRCHSPHWDLSPLGHVDRPVTPRIRRWMLMRELSLERDVDAAQLARLAEESPRAPARLPLGEGKVTCYSCHNPHFAGLFAADSELGALARNPRDRASALRTDWIDLCSECHQR